MLRNLDIKLYIRALTSVFIVSTISMIMMNPLMVSGYLFIIRDVKKSQHNF